MKHTAFSVAPNINEDDKEVPFYQKPTFKLVAGLGLAAVILLISALVAGGFIGGTTEVAAPVSNSITTPVTPTQEANDSQPNVEDPKVPIEQEVVGSEQPVSTQLISSVPVPGFIQGTKLETLYVSVRSYCKRHHATVMFAAVSVAILVVAGVAYAQHLENERLLQEHLLELERQRELERQQELLNSQLQNLVTEEGWNWGLIVRLVIAAYGASFILTIPLIFGDYLQNWDSLFKNSAAKRAAAYFVLFISLHSILAGIALVLFLMIVLIRQLIEHMPRSSFPRFVSLMVIGFFHILALIISIPLSVMAGVLHLLGDGEIIMRAYKGFWIESWRLYPISYNF